MRVLNKSSTSTISLLGLILALLLTAAASKSADITDLKQCTHSYAGTGTQQTCSSSVPCLGDSVCATAEGVCVPMEVFPGKACSEHYECYRGFKQTDDVLALYCDKDGSHTCQFTGEVGDSCQSNVQCQSRFCDTGVGTCQPITEGHSCETTADCRPYDPTADLYTCDASRCVSLPKKGEPCTSDTRQCARGLWCVLNVCQELDMKKEDDSCTPGVDINADNVCSPARTGAPTSDKLLCTSDGKCKYRPRLREFESTDLKCMDDYAERANGLNGMCEKQRCYTSDDCDGDEICDCKHLVCVNKNYGNRVNMCYSVDGTRKEKSDPFRKCLREKCPHVYLSTNAIMLNKKSCAYKKCKTEYEEHVKCLREAGESYGARNIYFFGK